MAKTLTPWTWTELANIVKFKDGTEREIVKHENKLKKFITTYDYAGALALEIARFSVLKNDPDASCYGPLCYLHPDSCSECFFSFLGMCCSDLTPKLFKKLAIEYEFEYNKAVGDVF
jgi:hypothetical protein